MYKYLHLAVSVCLYAVVSGVADAGSIHILSQGETLYSLARYYNIPVDELLEENQIVDPASLAVGTKLTIPNRTVGSNGEIDVVRSHQVVRGDTYYSIARRYELSVENLLHLNQRTANTILRVGERLAVSKSKNDDWTNASSTMPSLPMAGMVRVESVPWWPVAGIKRPLEGKLNGISIEAEPMSYVHAVAAGSVVWTGPYRGFGNVVLVDSGGYIYLYGGNDDLFVNVGQPVSAGNTIGRLGSSGPHGSWQNMYFSVFREGIPVSPENAPRG